MHMSATSSSGIQEPKFKLTCTTQHPGLYLLNYPLGNRGTHISQLNWTEGNSHSTHSTQKLLRQESTAVGKGGPGDV